MVTPGPSRQRARVQSVARFARLRPWRAAELRIRRTDPARSRYGTAENDREDAVTVKRDDTKRTPEAELRSFLDRFDPKARKLVRSVRAAVRKRFPTANELAYDYSSHVVIAYSPTERGIDSIVSIAARPDGVRLYFNQGPRLSDPKRLLQGSGKQARFIQVEAASRLAQPDVEALIGAAVDLAGVPWPAKGGGRVIIRGAAANQRPRRKPTK